MNYFFKSKKFDQFIEVFRLATVAIPLNGIYSDKIKSETENSFLNYLQKYENEKQF